MMVNALTGFATSEPFRFAPTIASYTQNYNIYTEAQAAGWDAVTPLVATVTVNAAVCVGSSSTGTYAFDTGSGFPTGSVLALVVNGSVEGKGGAPDSAGGPALRAQYAISITNNATIGGGGGGGGRGASGDTWSGDPPTQFFCSGGSGGSGAGNGAGATGGSNGSDPQCGVGGAGGGLGAAGSAGTAATGGWTTHGDQGVGGAAGVAVTGNSYITWVATGTRLGAIT